MNALARFPAPPPLSVGEFAPWFRGRGPEKATYGFASVGGRYVLMGFLPQDPAGRAAALAAVKQRASRFDDHNLTGFLVVSDAETIATARNDMGGLRWVFDPDGEVSRLYGALDDAGSEQPHWLLTDPFLRILAKAPIGSDAVLDETARLRPLSDYAGVPMHAPVLIVPRVFEPELCRRLIDLYEAEGQAYQSGVMRKLADDSVPVVDEFKKRRDAYIDEGLLRQEIMTRVQARLLPEIEKAFQVRITRMERYVVGCYDSRDGGYFWPHRDNSTPATAYRRFALSINLNTEEFEGGALRFPEFGPRTYRPPTGGAAGFCCSLLHEATAVTKGRRYAFLPFLYDEAGGALRAEHQAAVKARREA